MSEAGLSRPRDLPVPIEEDRRFRPEIMDTVLHALERAVAMAGDKIFLDRGGSGWVAAKVLASEGAHLYVAARRLEKAQELAEAIGGTALRCDASDERQVEAFVEAAAAASGRSAE